MSSVPQSIGMGGAGGQDSWTIPGAVGSGLSDATSALGAYRGLQSGTPQGYAGAAVNTGKLAGNLGAFGAPTSAANQGIGDAANALGIYNGIRQGGISGDSSAAVNAAQLGLKGAVQTGALSSAAAAPYLQGLGYAAIPLDLYNEVNSWKSGATGSDALAGASTGAAIGSVIPGIGTLIGGLVGGAAGALSSAFGPGEKDPESYTWGALSNAYNQAGKQGGQSAQQDLTSQVQDPYEALAGMFDLHNGQIDSGNTLYNQYGRMGEQKFTNDLVNQLNQAKSSGAINPNMDASQIYSSVVQPWENSWGKGQNTDPNAGLTQDLVTQMISQYEGGQAANDWQAVGGDHPFSNIYQGSGITPQPGAGVPVMATGNSGTRNVQRAADGGRTKRKSVLDSIRPSFAEVQHFDDGGSAYGSYTSFNPGNVIDFNSIESGGTGNDLTDFNNQNLGDIESSLAADRTASQDFNNYADSLDGTSSGSKSGSGKSGLGGLLKGAAPYAAALPLLSALAGKIGGSGSSPSTSLPSSQSTGPTGPFQAQSSPRTANAINPNTDWYTYGEHPETQFFSNNSIGPLMGKFTAQPPAGAAGPMSAPGGGSTPPMSSVQPVVGPSPLNRAHGGALDSVAAEGTDANGESRYVRGPGDGQSDDIDAKLSDGEYVMDAHTVSLLGNGSNEAGAKRLDQLRENLRKHAAKPMAKGKQFMKAKPPEAYLRGGKK